MAALRRKRRIDIWSNFTYDNETICKQCGSKIWWEKYNELEETFRVGSSRKTCRDEAAVVEEDMSPAQTPLVTLSFQKNDNRKQKYLEAEPKALGITQMGLSLFNITCASVFQAKGLTALEHQIPFFVSSLLVAIAGSLAVIAQNLHLPMLRACLGMQIVACGASIVNMICTLITMGDRHYFCGWYHNYNDNDTNTCRQVQGIHVHFYAESAVIQAALFAISVTLAAYCCKVVNCCAPAPKMPVITIQAPTTQQ